MSGWGSVIPYEHLGKTPDELIELYSSRKSENPIQPIPRQDWPLWAKAIKQFAMPEDKGIGDIVARMIGDENSLKFKAWHQATFGKPCNCNARQARWNAIYPL